MPGRPPPDNVLLVTPSRFAALVRDRRWCTSSTSGSTTQRSPQPATAADDMTRRANHLVAAVAGGALIGDNVQIALSAAREDALYARLLVLLLGVPGLILAVVVAALLSLRNDRQRATWHCCGCAVRSAAGDDALGGIALADGILGAILGGAGRPQPAARAGGGDSRPSDGSRLPGSSVCCSP